MFSNILGGAAGFPVADLGDEINQSLRFAADSVLHRDFSTTATSNTTGTFSFWVKKTGEAAEQTIVMRDGNHWFAAFPNTDELSVRQSGSGFSSFDNAKYRDPSAWYHFVLSINSNTVTAYVNGTQISTTVTTDDIFTSSTNSVRIGSESTSAASSNLDGYLAEFIFVDGQALDEEDFGRFNEDGVWVPDTYTGTYGTNGYHLDFADSSNPGNDVSGNNNDFTAVGFDTADVALYSAGLAASAAGSYESNAANRTTSLINSSQGFNGNLANQVQANGSAAWIYWTTNISCSNVTLIVNNDLDQTPDEIYINGSSVTVPTPTLVGSNYESTVSVSSGTLTEFAFKNQGGPNTSIFGMKVDGGSVLVDNPENDVDYNDTPTSNYATFNTVHTDINNSATLEEGNLFLSATTGSAHYVDARSSIPASAMDCYVEMYVRTWGGNNALMGIGVGDSTSRISEGTGNYVCYRQSGEIRQYSGNTLLDTESSYDLDDVIGMTINSTQVAFYKNGTLEGTYNHGLTGDFFVIGMAYDNGHDAELEFNFGQRPFIYTVPTGFSALQTENLDEPSIKDGRKHFNVLTWDGNGTDDRAITGLEFQPGLVWIKNRDATNLDYIVADGIMGNSRRLRSNSTAAFGSTTDFKNFTSDGFTLGDQSITNGGSSPNQYVAWCWNAPSSNTSNSDGDITTTIRANTDAGFCVMGFTGSTSAQKLGHGLNAEPEFVISKCVGVGSTSWQVYHKTLGVGSFLPFSGSEMSNISNFWGSTSDWDATTCGCSNNDSDNNKTDELMRWYIWHGVEGFSKFGEYTGNGDANGSFVYLGFKPALVVIRAAQADSNGAESWFAYDTARDTSNPITEPLSWNNQSQEGATVRDLDILSNGFKLRSAANQTNGNGTNYIYAAWAEHPSGGGENVPPATAR